MYDNPGCGFCVASENLPREHNINFQFVNIHNDPVLAQKYRPNINGIR
ncbi:MAG: hypothetical protein KC505_08550 [Myxococcales bacterium]|nr:hypothetical protein [Myxococcales bacterium]USN50246.1 MAG: hypothetical protein H6731_08230 [Myxococcales bacterium]